MKYDFIDKNIDRVYALVSEASFQKLDNTPLSLYEKEQIYRKVILIREYLEQCKVLWNEVEDVGIS